LPKSADYFPSSPIKERINNSSMFIKYKMLNESIFDKLDLETLFFIFYFQKVKKIQKILKNFNFIQYYLSKLKFNFLILRILMNNI
jgi:CCR4-NOT transcriptional regulation complex NOT5 subunit